MKKNLSDREYSWLGGFLFVTIITLALMIILLLATKEIAFSLLASGVVFFVGLLWVYSVVKNRDDEDSFESTSQVSMDKLSSTIRNLCQEIFDIAIADKDVYLECIDYAIFCFFVTRAQLCKTGNARAVRLYEEVFCDIFRKNATTWECTDAFLEKIYNDRLDVYEHIMTDEHKPLTQKDSELFFSFATFLFYAEDDMPFWNDVLEVASSKNHLFASFCEFVSQELESILEKATAATATLFVVAAQSK